MQIYLQKSFFYLSFDFFSDKLSVKKAVPSPYVSTKKETGHDVRAPPLGEIA